MSHFSVDRRSLFAGGAALVALGLAACSSTGTGSSSNQSEGASESPSFAGGAASETGLRDNDGYHLNQLTEGAPTVTLYTDYQCPYCKTVEPTYQDAAAELAGTMNVTVKNFPLTRHRYAVWASCAVQAAENQGQHLAMSNRVFAEQENWSQAPDTDAVYNDYFARYAQDLGLDMERFRADYSSDDTIGAVQADYRAGEDAGVRGTPSFVVEGSPLDSVDSSTSLSDMVDAFKSAAGL